MSKMKIFMLSPVSGTKFEICLRILITEYYYNNNADLSAKKALFELLPKCKDILFNCTWNFEPIDCCDIFDLQKTHYGYCYSFNSQTSMMLSKSEPRRLRPSGLRSGLVFTMKSPLFGK